MPNRQKIVIIRHGHYTGNEYGDKLKTNENNWLLNDKKSCPKSILDFLQIWKNFLNPRHWLGVLKYKNLY